MPYRNILWIKLEIRLLNDARFFLMREKSQLMFVKLLLIAAETGNKVPVKPETLTLLLRMKVTPHELAICIKEICKNFPKFKKTRGNYYFEEWDNRINQIREKASLGLAQRVDVGYPQDSPGVHQKANIEKKRVLDKIREEAGFPDSYKPFYDKMPIRVAQGRLWCVPNNGDKWLECKAKNNEIQWKKP